MKTVYHPQAKTELIEAAKFYESKVPGLGHAFIDEIEQAVRKITDDPRRFSIVEKDIRRFLLRRFPYGIYFALWNRPFVF